MNLTKKQIEVIEYAELHGDITLKNISDIIGKDFVRASAFIYRLKKRGIFIRVKNGLYRLSGEMPLYYKAKKEKNKLDPTISNSESIIRIKEMFSALCTIVFYKYGFTQSQINSSKRSRELTMCRMVIVHILDQYSGCSNITVGRIVGRDRTSVIYSIQRVNEALDGFDKSLKDVYDTIYSEFMLTSHANSASMLELRQFIDYFKRNRIKYTFPQILAQYLKEIYHEN